MGGSRLGRLRGALGARSRKEKAAGLAALALLASAPFGGLDRVPEEPPKELSAGHTIRVGPYDVTLGRAYRVKQYLGAQMEPWETEPVKPSGPSRRLLIVEADVVNDGKRPEYAHTLTNAVAVVGAAKVKGWGKPSAKPTLIYRADGSATGILNPGLTHRVAFVFEQSSQASARKAAVKVAKVIYVGKGGLTSNLDEDYWLVLDDDTVHQGVIPIGGAPAAVTR